MERDILRNNLTTWRYIKSQLVALQDIHRDTELEFMFTDKSTKRWGIAAAGNAIKKKSRRTGHKGNPQKNTVRKEDWSEKIQETEFIKDSSF